jgi:hypothetical protein
MTTGEPESLDARIFRWFVLAAIITLSLLTLDMWHQDISLRQQAQETQETMNRFTAYNALFRDRLDLIGAVPSAKDPPVWFNVVVDRWNTAEKLMTVLETMAP